MNAKFNRIMLVDDDVNTNIYNEIILNQVKAAEEILVYQNGKQALDFLETADKKVDLIFLDINMPIMNGWQFLEKYKELEDAKKAGSVVVMLTTSMNSEDKEKAFEYGVVGDFISKPLSPEALQEILNR